MAASICLMECDRRQPSPSAPSPFDANNRFLSKSDELYVQYINTKVSELKKLHRTRSENVRTKQLQFINMNLITEGIFLWLVLKVTSRVKCTYVT